MSDNVRVVNLSQNDDNLVDESVEFMMAPAKPNRAFYGGSDNNMKDGSETTKKNLEDDEKNDSERSTEISTEEIGTEISTEEDESENELITGSSDARSELSDTSRSTMGTASLIAHGDMYTILSQMLTTSDVEGQRNVADILADIAAELGKISQSIDHMRMRSKVKTSRRSRSRPAHKDKT